MRISSEAKLPENSELLETRRCHLGSHHIDGTVPVKIGMKLSEGDLRRLLKPYRLELVFVAGNAVKEAKSDI